jgi:microcin C transport system permease protein
MGYAIPGYALGSLLLLYFSVRLEWFPMSGFVSIQFAEMSTFEKVSDLVSHSVLPLICYLVGSFALVTLLLKNHLMDNLAADYMRTAIAKGVSFRRAVTKHAMRNSLIPIATTFGQNITLLVSGSFLIETIFDIDGFGLLGLTAILDRDYPVVMGVVFLGSLLLLIGNIISDFLVALVDPRIRFN